MPARSLTFRLLPGEYSVARLASLDGVAAPRDAEYLWSLTVTENEICLICPTDVLPEHTLGVRPGWAALMETDQPGAARGQASAASRLAKVGVPTLGVTAYATGYLLLPYATLIRAIGELQHAGHQVIDTLVPLETPIPPETVEFTGW